MLVGLIVGKPAQQFQFVHVPTGGKCIKPASTLVLLFNINYPV